MAAGGARLQGVGAGKRGAAVDPGSVDIGLGADDEAARPVSKL